MLSIDYAAHVELMASSGVRSIASCVVSLSSSMQSYCRLLGVSVM